MLCMTEKLLNSTVKHALGVSPNTLLFGDAILTEHSLLAEIDRIPTATPPRTIRDYVDKLMDRQSRLIVAAQKSQQKVNADNLEKRLRLDRHGYTISAPHVPQVPQHRNG